MMTTPSNSDFLKLQGADLASHSSEIRRKVSSPEAGEFDFSELLSLFIPNASVQVSTAQEPLEAGSDSVPFQLGNQSVNGAQVDLEMTTNSGTNATEMVSPTLVDLPGTKFSGILPSPPTEPASWTTPVETFESIAKFAPEQIEFIEPPVSQPSAQGSQAANNDALESMTVKTLEEAGKHHQESSNDAMQVNAHTENPLLIARNVQTSVHLSQKVVQQVMEPTLLQMESVQRNGNTEFTVRLDPPELGEILVRLKKSEGGILMRVTAIEKTTQAILEQNEQDLMKSMSDNGAEVSLEFGQESEFGQAPSEQQFSLSQKRRWDSRQLQNQSELAMSSRQPSPVQTVHDFRA